ncbi:glycosyl transferase-like protein, partial [Leptotrombidium deliense]
SLHDFLLFLKLLMNLINCVFERFENDLEMKVTFKLQRFCCLKKKCRQCGLPLALVNNVYNNKYLMTTIFLENDTQDNSTIIYLIRCILISEFSVNTKAMEKLTILVVPLSGVGHSHSIFGISLALLHRGHKVVIATERSWKGKYNKYGLEECLFDERDNSKQSVDDLASFMSSLADEFKKTPVERYISSVPKMIKFFYENAKYSNSQVEQIVEI